MASAIINFRWPVSLAKYTKGEILLRFATIIVLTAMLMALATPAGAKDIVIDTYAAQIAAVRKTAERQDDLALGRQMMIAAYDEAYSVKQRGALAEQVLKLTVPIGSDESSRLARSAISIAVECGALSPREQARWRRDIAGRRLVRANNEGLPASKLAGLARQTVEAHLSFIYAVGVDRKGASGAERSISAARQIVRSYKLIDLEQTILTVEQNYLQARDLTIKLRAATRQLEIAEKSKKAVTIRAARIKLAGVHLEVSGDIQAAAKYLNGTGHASEAPVSAAAEYLRSGKVDPANCLVSVSKLLEITKNYPQSIRNKVTRTAELMVEAMLADESNPTRIKQANRLGKRIRAMLGEVKDREQLAKLISAYGGLGGKAVPLGAGRVRVTYDFAKSSQLHDWQCGNGQWKVVRKSLVFRPAAKRSGNCASRLRFRTDRPLTLSYQAHASVSLEAQLSPSPADANGPKWLANFVLNRTSARVILPADSWRYPKHQLAKDRWHDVKIVSDGRGKLTWSVNDKVLFNKATGRNWAGKHDGLVVRLFLNTGAKSPAGLRNVMIEGELLPPAGLSPKKAKNQ